MPDRRPLPLSRRPLDAALVACFALFAFTSLVMEPYFVFNVDYHRAGDPFAAGWLFYATRFDPAFLDRPLFLRIICGIDLFVFGPFYLFLIWGFVRARRAVRVPALMFAAALIYSTVEYFAWELISERGRADLLWVFLINVPYTLMPLALVLRLRRAEPFVAENLDVLTSRA